MRRARSLPVGRLWPAALVHLGVGGLALLWLLPLLSAALTAVRTADDISLNGFWALPREVVGRNFAVAFGVGGVARYFANSLLITLPAVLATLALASLSAYALARYRFRGHLLIYAAFVAGITLPYQILMLPVFRLVSGLGLYNTHVGLVIVHTALQLGFATFVLRNFMRQVPGELIEAARVDGCGEFRIYWQMVLPLVLPALAAVATLAFTWVYNDYLWALLLLRSQNLRPVTAGLASLRGEFTTDWPVITAAALLAALPTLLVFTGLQRHFIRGLMLGTGR